MMLRRHFWYNMYLVFESTSCYECNLQQLNISYIKFYIIKSQVMNYSYNNQTIQQQGNMLICQMYDIQNLQPIAFAGKVQRFVNSGIQTDIINHLMECIKQFGGERTVKKYIYVADKMLKMPIFNQLMQHVIVQIFSDIFINLLIQKCFNQLDQIKILRKFWVKTIHPRLLSAMREFVYEKTKIDVDNQFKKQAIAHIKNYYQSKLSLSKQQMEFYLPKTIKTSHAVYQSKIKSNNQNYFNNQIFYLPHQQSDAFHLQNYPLSIIKNQNAYIQSPFISHPAQQSAMIMQNEAHYEKLKYFNQKPLNTYNNEKKEFVSSNSFSFNKQQIFNEVYHNEELQNLKRQRFASEQTRISYYNDPLIQASLVNQNIQIQNHRANLERQNKASLERQNKDSLERQNKDSIERQNKDSFDRQKYSNPYLNTQIKNFQTIQDHRNNKQQRQSSNDRDSHSSEFQQPIIRKLVHKNNQNNISSYDSERLKDHPKYLNIRSKLNESNQFICKECGKSFLTKKHMDAHLDQHFQDKISQIEKNKRGKKLDSLTIDQWTNIAGHQNLQFDQFYISVSLISTELTLQLKCTLCDQTFERVLKNDQWVFNNVTFCESMQKPMMEIGKKFLMHKSCQQILDQSSSSESQQMKGKSK